MLQVSWRKQREAHVTDSKRLPRPHDDLTRHLLVIEEDRRARLESPLLLLGVVQRQLDSRGREIVHDDVVVGRTADPQDA